MKELRDKMIYAAFIGDALSLGVHWVYSSRDITAKHGKVKDYIDPSESPYHSSKGKGDFTHYGDQMMVLLESIAGNRGFDPEKFSAEWRNFFKEYKGYFDGATKITLANLGNGNLYREAGSTSNDLAGASRIAPLVYLYHDDRETLIRHAREQTVLTHNDPLVIDAAAFFAETVSLVLHGADPFVAVEKTAKDKYSGSVIYDWVKKGIGDAGKDSIDALNSYGLTCHIDHAFPGVIQIIARHHNNLEEGIADCISAGGDNAARAIAVGMILGASSGSGDIPEAWLKGLNDRERIDNLISGLR